MKKILFCMLAMIVVLGLGATAQASLILKGQGTSVHGTHNLIYDNDLDITWYDFSNSANTWQNQVDWADALSVTHNSNTYDDWRLPATVDDVNLYGYNITNSEMGHLYYTELGNVASGGLSNTDDFQNLISSDYWSGTEYAALTSYAWAFSFDDGRQGMGNKGYGHYYGLAVRSGDVAAAGDYESVPEPTTILLLGIGLAGLAGRAVSQKFKKKEVVKH